jgi:Domain of unknown function (DUF4251)
MTLQMKTKIVSPVITYFIVMFAVCGIFGCTSTKKSTRLNSADVQQMLNNKNLTFIADRVTPMRGPSRTLTSYYEVRIHQDSLTSYLPYFGRAYVAPMNPAEGGIQFTSTNFAYQLDEQKNKTWNLAIKPNDYPDIQQLYFVIFDNGTGTLNVTSTHKDPISFSGHLKPVNPNTMR